jgi:hypothetical protein
MEQFIRFGEIEDKSATVVYECLIDGNDVKVVLPKTNHPAAQDLARSIGFGDLPTYLVTGYIIGGDSCRRPIITRTKIIAKLEYDSEKELYVIPQKTKGTKVFFNKKRDEKENEKQVMKLHKKSRENIYDRIGFWEYTKCLMTAGWPAWMIPKFLR